MRDYKEFLRYDELEKLLRIELKKINNVLEFSKKIKLSKSNYNKLSEISNKRKIFVKKKRVNIYPALIARVLKKLGYQVKEIKLYKVTRKDDGKNDKPKTTT